MKAGRASFVSTTFRRLLAVKSARGVSFMLSAIPLASKPLGYLRTLITAWVFGTSPGMDAFHLANSIVTLFAGSIGNALQGAVLPELVRARHETGSDESSRTLAAFSAWAVFVLTVVFCAAILIAPGVLVKFFASGFDSERIQIGALMLWWLIPIAVVSMCKPVADIWALFTERYTLSSICSLPFNFLSIPALLLAIPLIGVYSVAFSISVSHTVLFILFLYAMHGVPVAVRRGCLPISSLVRIGKNILFTTTIFAANTFFMVIDRYFASRLPSGSVAAISYGAVVIGVIALLSDSSMVFFLTKLSGAAVSGREKSARITETALAIALAYFTPIGLFVSAAARPIVSLLYGWGNFDANSVDMTVTAISAYCLGVAFSVSASVLHRYAQAIQKLDMIVALTFPLIAVNWLLDWLMVGRWGIMGLALATSVTQALGFVLSYALLIGRGLPSFLIRSGFFQQTILSLACAAVPLWLGAFGLIIHSVSALLIASAYFWASERLGIMPYVPAHWRPTKLVSFFFSSAKSYFQGQRGTKGGDGTFE
ncbi:MAG: polysaccharide biosynthesis C-terminal domain-containing protein [Synergistaceae bacterium]|jgi:putative peptidoglycan lipid II flippase|nr:polysaccharide biosynthesis C-terminal domain-containing protein [Synergistaceae bacterium]